jgi:hypothetical protein
VGREEGDALEAGEDDLDDVTVKKEDDSAYRFWAALGAETFGQRNPQSLCHESRTHAAAFGNFFVSLLNASAGMTANVVSVAALAIVASFAILAAPIECRFFACAWWW